MELKIEYRLLLVNPEGKSSPDFWGIVIDKP